MKSFVALFIGLCLFAAAPQSAWAQEAEVTTIEEVVVLARRSGAPMWTVTRGDSTLILVGAISGIPRDLEWRPDDLEAAAARSQLILTPPEGRASVSDLLRVVWRARTLMRMPAGQTSADYLTPEWQARLEAVMADERNQDWRRKNFLMLGSGLMRDKAGYTGSRGGDDAIDVIQRAARRARIQTRPVGTVRGDDLVDSMLAAPQSDHVPCVEAAIVAAEAGPDAARRRAEDWRSRRVAEVVASPIDRALNQCWPWSDAEIAPVLHQQWAAAIETALISPGVTMAVAQIRLLADEGGVLDGLEARGLEVDGPEWKAQPDVDGPGPENGV